MLALVKGRYGEVTLAAFERNIDVTLVAQRKVFEDHYECLVEVDNVFEDKVVRWYCEPSLYLDEIGYPIGTCLFYNSSWERVKP